MDYSPVPPGESGKPDEQAPESQGLHKSPQFFKRHTHSWHLFRREIYWRLAGVCILGAFIVVILHSFERMGNLSSWDRRWFNTLTIFFSSLVSLMLGSLLNFLGSMLRWRLLAGRKNTPLEVDLLLAIPSPTGSFRLIWHHTKGWRWTTTTLVVAVYLILTLAGRLGIAALGLAFDLNEIEGINYPVMVTDWSGFGVQKIYEDRDDWHDNAFWSMLEKMENIAQLGLSSVSIPFDYGDPSQYAAANMSGQGLYRKVDGKVVTYSYFLKEYHGDKEWPSKYRVLHSSSNCTERIISGDDIREGGKIIYCISDIWNNTPSHIRILRLLPDLGNTIDTIWASWLGYESVGAPSTCSTTFIYSNDSSQARYHECKTCITHQDNQPGVGINFIRSLAEENSTETAKLLTRSATAGMQAMNRNFSGGGSIIFRPYFSSSYVSHLLDTFSDPYGYYGDPTKAELNTAHLTARLPILTLIGAGRQFPRVPLEPGGSEQPYVNTVLRVKWPRVIAVLVSIAVGQLVSVAVVLFMCRKVIVRDHNSYLSTAWSLREFVGLASGGSVDSGEVLASRLKDKCDVGVTYGSRQCMDDPRVREVGFWEDVNGDFSDGEYR